jgi:uncharacterized protein YndB with AHSA1/START domain
MGAGERQVSVERVIEAPPGRIFDVLADPAQHPVIDGSGSVRAPRGRAPDRLSLGDRFGMSMRIGLPYLVTNRVVELEEARRIAWRHAGGQTWRYELEPAGAGTLVRETFDWSTARVPLLLEVLRAPARNRTAMEATLERLERVVTSG